METNAETNAAAESNHEPQVQQQQSQDHDWQQDVHDQKQQQQQHDQQQQHLGHDQQRLHQDEEICSSVYKPMLTDLMNNAFDDIMAEFKNANDNLANEYRQETVDIQSQTDDLLHQTRQVSNRLFQASEFFQHQVPSEPQNIEDVYSNRPEVEWWHAGEVGSR